MDTQTKQGISNDQQRRHVCLRLFFQLSNVAGPSPLKLIKARSSWNWSNRVKGLSVVSDGSSHTISACQRKLIQNVLQLDQVLPALNSFSIKCKRLRTLWSAHSVFRRLGNRCNERHVPPRPSNNSPQIPRSWVDKRPNMAECSGE